MTISWSARVKAASILVVWLMALLLSSGAWGQGTKRPSFVEGVVDGCIDVEMKVRLKQGFDEAKARRWAERTCICQLPGNLNILSTAKSTHPKVVEARGNFAKANRDSCIQLVRWSLAAPEERDRLALPEARQELAFTGCTESKKVSATGVGVDGSDKLVVLHCLCLAKPIASDMIKQEERGTKGKGKPDEATVEIFKTCAAAADYLAAKRR